MKKKLAAAIVPLVVRVPRKVIAALDREAVKNCRSRSSEVRVRLVQSLETAVRT